MPGLKQPLKLAVLAAAVREQVFPALFPVLLEILLQYRRHKVIAEELLQRPRQITERAAVVARLLLEQMEPLQMAAMEETAPHLQFRVLL